MARSTLSSTTAPTERRIRESAREIQPTRSPIAIRTSATEKCSPPPPRSLDTPKVRMVASISLGELHATEKKIHDLRGWSRPTARRNAAAGAPLLRGGVRFDQAGDAARQVHQDGLGESALLDP